MTDHEHDSAMIRQLFELSADELVVQNYRCAYWKEGDKLPSQGRLYITTRFACWIGSLTALQLRIDLSAVTAVTKEKALMGLVSTALEISVKGSPHAYHLRTFAGSAKRDEAFALLEYLVAHPADRAAPADGDPLPILLKEPNGALHAALLLLYDDAFAIVDTDGRELSEPQRVGYRKLLWPHADIEGVQLRARPLHVDVRFNDGSQRLRFACIYVQTAVVRLVNQTERARRVPVDVTFEHGVTPFDPRVELKPQPQPQQQQQPQQQKTTTTTSTTTTIHQEKKPDVQPATPIIVSDERQFDVIASQIERALSSDNLEPAAAPEPVSAPAPSLTVSDRERRRQLRRALRDSVDVDAEILASSDGVPTVVRARGGQQRRSVDVHQDEHSGEGNDGGSCCSCMIV
jgi:hypothetical protein